MPSYKRRAVAVIGLIVLPAAFAFILGEALSRLWESRGLRKLVGGKAALLLQADAGFAPLTTYGLGISSAGFIAKVGPPRALAEMRAARLRAQCNLAELWQGQWRIEKLTVEHMQAAFGAAAAQRLKPYECRDLYLLPPLQTESPIEIDIREIGVARTDLFWGDVPEDAGEFRNVQTNFFPEGANLLIRGNGGTFQQARFPAARLQQCKLLYAKPDLRIEEAALTFGAESKVEVGGGFRFERPASCDLQLTFTRCPVAPFLNGAQQSKLDGEFDGICHLQKVIGHAQAARAIGSIAIAKAVMQNVESLQKVANFTRRAELARLPINEIKAEYDWDSPTLTVKNFVLASNGLVIVKGEFHVRERKIDGEFEIGLVPDLVDKFPGAREEIFNRNEGGYLWTQLTLSGTLDHLRENLRPRLVRAAQNHFAKGLVVPMFKPGQTVIQAIEAL